MIAPFKLYFCFCNFAPCRRRQLWSVIFMSIIFMSCYFMSGIFMSCTLVRHFHVLQFHALQFWWSVIFMSSIFSQPNRFIPVPCWAKSQQFQDPIICSWYLIPIPTPRCLVSRVAYSTFAVPVPPKCSDHAALRPLALSRQCPVLCTSHLVLFSRQSHNATRCWKLANYPIEFYTTMKATPSEFHYQIWCEYIRGYVACHCMW